MYVSSRASKVDPHLLTKFQVIKLTARLIEMCALSLIVSADLTAHLPEVCSEFDHVCLFKSIKSRSTSAHKISSDQTHCTHN